MGSYDKSINVVSEQAWPCEYNISELVNFALGNFQEQVLKRAINLNDAPQSWRVPRLFIGFSESQPISREMRTSYMPPIDGNRGVYLKKKVLPDFREALWRLDQFCYPSGNFEEKPKRCWLQLSPPLGRSRLEHLNPLMYSDFQVPICKTNT